MKLPSPGLVSSTNMALGSEDIRLEGRSSGSEVVVVEVMSRVVCVWVRCKCAKATFGECNNQLGPK